MDPFNAKLVAAACGSTLTALTMTPFDVVKTRLQTQIPQQIASSSSRLPLPSTACCQPNEVPCVNVRRMSSLAVRPRLIHTDGVVCLWENGVLRTERVNGFADAVRHVWRAEGVRGLWKGAATSLVIGVPSATTYMLTYDHLLNVTLPPLLHSSVPGIIPLTAGIIARTSISTLMSPLELIRTNLQSTPLHPSTPHTLASTLASIRTLVRTQGVPSLWRGLGPTLWRDVPFSGLYWASYEGWKEYLQNKGHQGVSVSFASGAVSGTTAALVTSPFDVLKTRRQALVMSSTGGSKAVTSTMPLLVHIVRTEGMAALYAGLLPRIAKIAPACGIMIASFEGIGKFLARKDTY